MSTSAGTTPKPVILVVTGLPAAGKTTLARQISVAVGLPLLSLDVIKESLYDAPGGAERSRRELRFAAEAVVRTLLADAPCGAVLDIWLDPTREDRNRLRALLPVGVPVREILCDVPAEVAIQRYADRTRHGAHRGGDAELRRRISEAAEMLSVGGPSAPVALGPAIRVDTTREVVVPEILEWLSASPGR